MKDEKRIALIKYMKQRYGSKEYAARSWNMSLSQYQAIERGIRNPSFKKLTEFIKLNPQADIKQLFFNEKVYKE